MRTQNWVYTPAGRVRSGPQPVTPPPPPAHAACPQHHEPATAPHPPRRDGPGRTQRAMRTPDPASRAPCRSRSPGERAGVECVSGRSTVTGAARLRGARRLCSSHPRRRRLGRTRRPGSQSCCRRQGAGTARPGTEPNQPGPWPPAPAGPAGRPRPAGVGPGASVTRMILTRSAGPVWVTVPGPQVLIPNRIMPRILGVGVRVLWD